MTAVEEKRMCMDCRGAKKVDGLGYMKIDCRTCNGVGYLIKMIEPIIIRDEPLPPATIPDEPIRDEVKFDRKTGLSTADYVDEDMTQEEEEEYLAQKAKIEAVEEKKKEEEIIPTAKKSKREPNFLKNT